MFTFCHTYSSNLSLLEICYGFQSISHIKWEFYSGNDRITRILQLWFRLVNCEFDIFWKLKSNNDPGWHNFVVLVGHSLYSTVELDPIVNGFPTTCLLHFLGCSELNRCPIFDEPAHKQPTARPTQSLLCSLISTPPFSILLCMHAFAPIYLLQFLELCSYKLEKKYVSIFSWFFRSNTRL